MSVSIAILDSDRFEYVLGDCRAELYKQLLHYSIHLKFSEEVGPLLHSLDNAISVQVPHKQADDI